MARDRVHGLDVIIHPTFDSAEPSWRDLEARGSGFVFQSFDWCITWFETIGRARQVEPVLIHVGDPHTGAEMFLPLGIEPKRYGVRALGFLDGRLADHTAPVLAGPTDIAFDDVRTRAVLRRVAKVAGADVVDLRHLRTRVGGSRNPLVNASATWAGYATHSLKLEGTWDAFCAERLSTSHKAGNRRRLRRLQAHGAPRMAVASSVAEALTILETTLEQKARQYRETGRPDMLASACYPEFYRRMTARHHPRGLVHVAALTLDDQVIATHWGCVHKERFIWLMPSYDAAWRKASPGRLLLEHLIAWSFREGLREFDFTIGDEPYKATFCNVSDGLYRWVRPRSPLGWAYQLKASLVDGRLQVGGGSSGRRRPPMPGGVERTPGPT
jgi:CelD/BcsL family acetyltransferase involved in cellulose biosynthesis